MLICVTGKKRSGKDSLGTYLIDKYNYAKARPLAVFKFAFADWFGWDERHLEGELKEVVDERYGFSPRELMQVFGTELMKYDLGKRLPKYKETCANDIWVFSFLDWYAKQDKTKDYVLTDVRFPNEYSTISRALGDDVFFVRTVSDRSPSDVHESESYIDVIPVDYSVINNGWNTFDKYYKDIDKMMRYMNELYL